MFAAAVRKARQMWGKIPAFVALVALVTSGLVVTEVPQIANAAIVTNNLVLNLDASDTTSLATSSPTFWKSIAPGSNTTAQGTLTGNASRGTTGSISYLSFDGQGDGALFPAGTGNTPGSMTYETWVNLSALPNTTDKWSILASRWFNNNTGTGTNTTGDQDWQFSVYNNSGSIKLRLDTYANYTAATPAYSSWTPTTGSWVHLGFQYTDAGQIQFFVNGQPNGTAQTTTHTGSTTAVLAIGDGRTYNYGMTGKVSKVRLYSAALTSAQIAQNFLSENEAFGVAPINTVAPVAAGVAKVNKALTADPGTWGAGDNVGATTAYQWQISTDKSVWTDIVGSTSSTYTIQSGDASKYIRVAVKKTNTAGNTTAYSASTNAILPATYSTIASGGKLTGLTSTVPNDANTYNVTLASSNLSSTILLGTTTGLTWVEGRSVPVGYMATSLTNPAPIVTFRGTGTAINTALANVTYTSTAGNNDVVKLYYATGASASATDTKNYIPIYDNNQLTFHYYAYKYHGVNKNRSEMEAALVGLTTTDYVMTPGPWYLSTPRYDVEWTRIKAITGTNAAYMGALSDAGSQNWYWPANTDGYSSATIYATSAGTGSITATSNIYNNANTTLPYAPNEPNGGTTLARTGYFYVPSGGTLGWDDTPVTTSVTNYTMETFGTAPFATTDGSASTLTQTFHISTLSNAPTGLTSSILGDTASLSWTAPTTPGTEAISDYQIDYSIDGTIWSNWVHTPSTATSAKITGLIPGTAYYVRVAAITSDVGTYTASTLSTVTATTINVVASNGGVSGTDYVVNSGYLSAKSAATINVNASEIQTLLASSNVILAADTVNVNAPISWSANTILTLGNKTTSTVAINKTISGGGTSAGVRIASTSYSLDVKTGASIVLSGTTSTLSIGGTAYTLIRSTADLLTVAATGNYALSKPIAYAAGSTALSQAPIAQDFTGTLDGLGNTVDRMNLALTASRYAGLIQRIGSGAAVRNIGVTNASVTMSTLSSNYVVGLIAGAKTQAGAATIDQTWSSGMIQSTGSTINGIAAGGILGLAQAGSLTISKSWSSASIDTRTSGTGTVLLQGGIIGGDQGDVVQQAYTTNSGGAVTLNQVYATGTLQWASTYHRGIGGLFGLHYQSAAAASITDSFSWVNFANSPTGNLGGIIGVAAGAATTITRAYQTTYLNTCYDAYSSSITVTPSCSTAQTIGSNSTTTGMSGSAWTTTGTSALVNLPTPTKPIYVQVVAPTDGTYSTMAYKLVDATGSVVSTSASLVLSGTPNYSISRSTVNGTYSVDYISGLSLSGSSGIYYSLQPWITPTSVTISAATSALTTAPTGVTVSTTGTGALAVGWTAATTTESTAISGYTVRYSSSEYMTSPTSVSVGNVTGTVITGLTNSTAYYFQVRAVGGSTWSGVFSSVATGTPSATATTINVVASGTAVAGTDYTVKGGVISATGTVSISAADVASVLATQGTVQLAADTVNINSPLSWSTDAILTLGNTSSSAVNINSTVAGSGNSAGIKILPSTYGLAVKSGAYLRLTGTTPSFNLGGVAYTVVNTVAGISNIAATGNYAITAQIPLTATYNSSIRNVDFAGVLDGLGNTVNNATYVTVAGTVNYGFFNNLTGGTVRNIGFTNVNFSSSVANLGQRLGSVAGIGCVSGTCTISQVWATGFINQTATSGQVEAGGIVGGATGGTLNISKTWSSVAVSTSAPSVGSGGIIGTNSVALTAGNGTGNTLNISESYSTGNILRYLATASWYGNGGIIGVAYGAATTINNSFSWGNINSTGLNAGTSTAGIVGVPHTTGTTVTNSYTTSSTCGGNTVTNCVVSATAGVALTSGTGFTSGVWQSVNGTSLTNLTPPTKSLYVQVVAPTDGSYATMTYQIVDSTGTVQNLTNLGLTISGTPTYSIASNVARGTYSVSYVSNLTLAGSSASVYSLNAWITNTSVSITRLAQSFSWSPTTAIPFGAGSFTPSATPVSEASSIISYSVASAGTSGCTVGSSTGVVSYTSGGTCSITATGASTVDFTSNSATVNFTIAAAPTITVVASGGGAAGTDFTISGGILTATSNVSVDSSTITTQLASGNLILAGNVVVNSDISWTSSSVLTLGGASGNTVDVNANIAASGNTAGLVIKPASYGLDTKSGDTIQLTGTTSTLSIGGNSYTLIRAIADLSSVTASGYFALAKPLTYSTVLSTSPIAVSFAGTFDGLGNTVDKAKVTLTSNANLGFFKTLAGGTIRNLGITNLVYSLEPAATTYAVYVGGLVGESTGGTMTQVWTSGILRIKASSTYASASLGGLVGNVTSGTLSISKSWSSTNAYAWASTFTNQVNGGLVGSTLGSWSATSTTAGGSLTLNQVAAYGDLASQQSTGLYAQGGILGLHTGTGTVTVTDAVSWSQISNSGSANYGGVIGYSVGGSVTVTNSSSYVNQTAPTTSSANKVNTYYSVGFGGSVANLSSLANWYESANGTALSALPLPKKNIFVQVTSDGTGSYAGLSWRPINGVIAVFSAATLTTLGITITGTPTYSVASDVAISATPYAIDYVSGVTLGGTKVYLYNLMPYYLATNVTISKYSQSITWAPTTSVNFGNGTLTPSATPTASGGTAISYAVSSAGTTGCTVNSSTGVITYTAAGSCAITATAANSGNYLDASTTVTFVIGAAPTITVVASNGGTLGTDYTITNGLLQAAANVNVNAADLASALNSGNVTLAGNVVVNADLSWTGNTVLTLGGTSNNSVTVNSIVTGSGNTAGIVIKPVSYTLDTKSGDAIRLTGTTPTLSIGGNSYTLIKAISGLASVTTSGYYALAKPLTFTSATASSPMVDAFAGTFDGLGNTFDRMVINATTNGKYGLFPSLGGATIRNLGIINGWVSAAVTSAGTVNGGMLAGEATGTNLIEQVWTTGLLSSQSGSYTRLGFGGLIADATAGSITINRSWSSTSIYTSGITVTSQAIGGILGCNTSFVGGGSDVAGATVVMNEVYSTGDLNYASATNWRGIGGIMGLAYATNTTTLNDVFSWSTLSANDGNYAGLVGVTQGGVVSVNRAYTTYSTTVWSGYAAGLTASSVSNSIALGTSTVAGLTTSVWSSSGAKQLVNLPAPKRPRYLQVVAPTDGSYGSITNNLIDGKGAFVTTGAAFSVTGTPTHTIDASSALGTYSVLYVGGLSTTGTDAAYYSLGSWPIATSVTISKWAQSISLTSTAPTTATVGSTYSMAGTASSSLAITYTIDSTTTSICSIASGVVTFNAIGTCKINANQAGNASYLAAPQVQQSAIVTVKGTPTITITSTALLPKVAGATYTPTATSTSGLAVTFTIATAAADYCSIAGGVVSFTKVGDCVINANSASTTNWNAATQVSQTMTVGKGASTVSITSTAPVSAVVGGTGYTLTSTKTTANTNSVVYSIDSTATSVCSVTSGVVTFQTVGTCKVNANLDGDSQYEAATQVQQTFSVAKGAQVLSFTSNAPNAAKVGGANYTVTATGGASTSAIVLSVDSGSTTKCSVSGMEVTYLAVGNCVLNLNQAGDTNYNAATQVQQTVVITSDGRCPTGVVSGNYCLVRFNSSGTWTVPAGVTSVDILTVGGGGAGGSGTGTNQAGGGGGGGEVIDTLGRAVTPGNLLTISVGAGGTGGAGATTNSTAGTAGGATSVTGSGFVTITSRGGGQGASYNLTGAGALAAGAGPTVAGGGGGSGGPTSRGVAAGSGGVSNGGAPNNNDTSGSYQTGGGGGGAGGNGSAGTTVLGGAGGAGKASTISGTTLGGGGGGAKRDGTGTGGGTAAAGGGAGGWGTAGTAGTANTGGGGGGSGGANGGANGGSGLVLIRVALQSQTVAFTSTAPTGLVYGTSTTYIPTASGTASEAAVVITVDAASSAVCSIDAGVVSIIGAGTCTLNANQAGNGFYAPATQVQQSFTVAKKAQAITFSSTAPTNAVVGGSTYTITANGGGSTSSIVFSTASSGCTVSGAVVSFTAVGDCVVKANQAADSNYLVAPEVTQTISVAKGTQVVAFTSTAPTTAVVDGSTYTVTASGGNSGNAVVFAIATDSAAVCSISGSVVTFLAKGTCVVTANQAGSSNYNAASEVSQSIAVGEGSQAISFTSTIPSNAIVGGAGYTVTATGGASGKPVTFSVASASSTVCTISAATVTFIGVGNCVIEANQDGNANYFAATQATQTVVVGKGTQVLMFSSSAPSAAVVEGATYTPTAIGGLSGNDVVFSIASASSGVCAISSGVVSFTAPGSCVVEANQAGSDNWNAANQVTQTFTVGKGSQVVAFTSSAPTWVQIGDLSDVYTPAATGGSSTSAVTISIAAASTSICHITGGEVSYDLPGSCVIEANQAEDSNFLAAPTVTQTISVAKGTQAISWVSAAPTGAVVDGANFTPSAAGGASGEPVTYTIADDSALVCGVRGDHIIFFGTGECAVWADQAGNAQYLAAPRATLTFNVGKGSQTITFDTTAPTNAVVSGATYTPSATGGATGHPVTFRADLNSASVCTVSSGVVSFVGVGTCVILANQVGDSNYENATQVSQSFVVGKGSQTITFTSTAPSSAAVAGAQYTPAATGGRTGNAVIFGIASSSTAICNLVSGKVSFTAPGNCVIEAAQAGNTNYNAAPLASQTVVVAKGTQAISFTSTYASAKVGGNTYSPVATGGASGKPVTFSVASAASAICTIANGIVSFTAVGNCVIEANQAGNSNYDPAPVQTQTISVAKGTQVVSFTSTPPHNAQVQGLTYTPTATGSASGVPVVFSVPASAQVFCTIANGVVSFHSVGNCVLYADQAGNDNWTAATRISQIFDVTKGQQVVTITSTAPTSAVVDGASYTIAATGGNGSAPVTYSISELATEICSVTDTTVTFHAAGDCVVVASQDGDAQFNPANPVSQTFSVAKGSQVLAFIGNASNPSVDGTAYGPVLTYGSGTAPVQLSTADAAVCEIVDGAVIFHQAVDCTVYADQAGDANYESATQISQTFTIAKGVQQPLVGYSSLQNLTLGEGNTPYAVLSVSGGSGTGLYGWSVNTDSADICSITDDVVEGHSVGVCVIDLVRLGDDNYEVIGDSMQITVSSGNQAPVVVQVSDQNPVYSPGSSIFLSLIGGAGDGSVWYESSTPHTCNTDGDNVLHILHAGTCTVVGHKDGNGTYQPTLDELTFVIARATDDGVAMSLTTPLVYSSVGPVSSTIEVSGLDSTGVQALNVTSGNCTIEYGELVSSVAGDCEVQLTVDADENYEAVTLTQTFSVAKAQQAAVTAARELDQPVTIGTSGVKTTMWRVSGGSGNGDYTATVADASICSVEVTGDIIAVTGLAVGSCAVTVTKRGDSNHLAATTSFTVQVVGLPAAPSSVTLANTGHAVGDDMELTVGWTPATQSSSVGLVSGFEVQSKVNGVWTTVSGGIVAANATTLTIAIPAWTKVQLRVAPISAIDPADIEARNWTNFTGTNGGTTPVDFPVPGALNLISTNLAAVTSGEVVTLTGSGFDPAITTRIQLSTSTAVFAASSIGAAAVAPVNTKIVNATVISDTKISFVLPKITLPKGTTSLTTMVKVLSTDGIASPTVPFDYIPAKLKQTMTMTGTLPAATTVLDVGVGSADALTTNATFTSTGLPPVVTATPAGVCTARLNDAGKLVIDPVSPGKCTISVQAPATPGYLPSAAKVTTVNIKQQRTTEFAIGVREVRGDGTYGDPALFNQANTLLVPGSIDVQIGEGPVELQVGLAPRQGTTLFTVLAADELAGRCTADPGDEATSGAFGSITITDIGDCNVTISQPADSGWYAGATIRLVIHATARTTPVADNGQATLADSADLVGVIDPKDPDDPDTPPVVLDLDPTQAGDYSFGSEDGLMYDPATGKLNVRSRTPLVGTWTATLTGIWTNPIGSDNKPKNWFKIPGKIVKKVQTYTYANVCKLTLVVKKDPKLKKKVTRIVGAGCLLSDAGKAALTSVGIQKIKVKYKRIRQYAKTGLSYVKVKGNRVLKNINRTWVIRVGRRS